MVENTIEIDDKVFIGGIYGDDFKMVNNKIGIIKKIMFTSSGNFSTHIADVLINNKIFPINLGYVFKLNDLDTYDYDGILDFETPIQYYYKKFNVIGNPRIVYDQKGTNHVLCITRENNLKPLTLTSIN